MKAQELRAKLAGLKDPEEAQSSLPPLIVAMCWEARGSWEKAYLAAQEVSIRDGAWVHAYLHRAERDLGNAGYWYRRAGRPASARSGKEIVEALLSTKVA